MVAVEYNDPEFKDMHDRLTFHASQIRDLYEEITALRTTIMTLKTLVVGRNREDEMPGIPEDADDGDDPERIVSE